MKKLLLIIAALFVSFNTFGQIQVGDEIEIDDFVYEVVKINPNQVHILEYSGSDNSIKIPNTIIYDNITYTITGIIAKAFYKNMDISSVFLPETINTIGERAFYDCKNLSISELDLSNLTSIGNRAFYNVQVTKIKLYNTTIGDYAFTSLETIECKSTTPPSIGTNSFGNNSNLKIHVPEGCVNAYKFSWTEYANNIQGEDPIVFSSNGNWSDTDKWDGLPDGDVNKLADKDVIIKANAIIQDTNIIKVKSFKIEGNGSITIEEGGQLIVHATSTGNVTMEKNISKYSAGTDNVLINGWYTISSPFEGSFTLSENNFLKGTYELFRYNEATSMWENQKAHSDFTTLEPGKGYLYANKEGQTLSITGEPNIGSQDIKLTAKGTVSELKGFNLIGNPFTHNIYKGEGASIYDKNLSEGYYTLTNEGKWQTILDSEPIKPMQGILVKTDAECSITIGHTHKSPSSKRSNNGVIAINVANNEYNDVAYISFNKGIGLDKIEHRNNEIPMVYVPVDGTDYAIAIMDKNAEEIPVNFEAKKMGEYTIGISAEGRKYSKLTLIDKQDNNKEIDMLKGNYTFLATTTDDPARFILKVSLNNNQEAAFYTENNSIIIENIKGKGSVQVYDVMGRPVIKYNTNDSNCQLSTSSLANGVYIIQLIDENGTQVQKVIVNN